MARVVLGAVALSLVLAGCGGDPEAPPDATATTSGVSTTPSTPPTPSAPALPEAATANTKAGAIAFVRHYVEVQNYAARTGQTKELAALSQEACDECRAILNRIKRVYAQGGHIEGDGWAPVAVRHLANAPGPTDLDYVVARLRVSPQSIFDGPSASPSVFAGNERLLMTFGLKHSSPGWQLARMQVGDS